MQKKLDKKIKNVNLKKEIVVIIFYQINIYSNVENIFLTIGKDIIILSFKIRNQIIDFTMKMIFIIF